jgi:hypothetical protein
VPQELTSLFDLHWLPQRWVPPPQAKSQAPLVQVGVAPAALGQGEQEVPQELTSLFDLHWLPQR